MKTYEKPVIQNFTIPGVKHIAADEALELVKNEKAVMIDVREEEEVDIVKIPLQGVLYHPMSAIMDNIDGIEKTQHIILVCMNGIRSVKIANLFNRQGFCSVANLDGGLLEWNKRGYPIFQQPHHHHDEHHSCTCHCNDNNACEDNTCC